MGLFDYHVESIRTMLSASIAWQDYCNTVWASEAAARIHLYGLLPDPGEEDAGLDRFRPFAVVGLTEDQRGELVSGGMKNTLSPSGQVSLYLTGWPYDPSNFPASITHWARVVSDVLQELLDQAGVNENCPIIGWQTAIAPRRGLIYDVQGALAPADWCEVEFHFDWS